MVERRRHDAIRAQARLSVEKSTKNYEKYEKGYLEEIKSVFLLVFSQTFFIIKAQFMVFALIVLILQANDLDASGVIKGLYILLGSIILLFPMASFSLMYKLTSVLKYIVLNDMVSWIIIYVTISIGFAAAIKFQFDELPNPSACDDLSGFLTKTGHTFFELVVMTSGLDTELKQVRNLACLFQDNSKNVTMILLLITMYAVISAVVLLNMLIAIMSNTVTVAQ